jgi:hypothetical protein
MTIRKGLGKGQGSGYKNILLAHDRKVHHDAGLGRKQPQRMGQLSGKSTIKRDINKVGSYEAKGVSEFWHDAFGGKMSRKDYEAIAKIVGTATDENNLRMRLQDYMAQDNPDFDANRFQLAIDKWKAQKGGKSSRPSDTEIEEKGEFLDDYAIDGTDEFGNLVSNWGHQSVYKYKGKKYFIDKQFGDENGGKKGGKVIGRRRAGRFVTKDDEEIIYTAPVEVQTDKQYLDWVKEVELANKVNLKYAGEGDVFNTNKGGKNPTLKVFKVNAGDVFDDDNNGLKYGLEEAGDAAGYVEWFKTKAERDKVIKKNNMKVIGGKADKFSQEEIRDKIAENSYGEVGTSKMLQAIAMMKYNKGGKAKMGFFAKLGYKVAKGNVKDRKNDVKKIEEMIAKEKDPDKITQLKGNLSYAKKLVKVHQAYQKDIEDVYEKPKGGKNVVTKGINRLGTYDAKGVKLVGHDIGRGIKKLYKKGGKDRSWAWIDAYEKARKKHDVKTSEKIATTQTKKKYKKGGKLKDKKIIQTFTSSKGTKIKVVRPLLFAEGQYERWSKNIKEELISKYGEVGWKTNASSSKLGYSMVEDSTLGGKRIRSGMSNGKPLFHQGDRIRKGNWSDKRWKKSTTKDNKQIGKKYESWEKSKYQRWK